MIEYETIDMIIAKISFLTSMLIRVIAQKQYIWILYYYVKEIVI